jgi:DNA-directed RNA polymerase I subunit RPA1
LIRNSFYDDTDVRNRSVVEITSPMSFDPNNAPLPNGLYDPRLGATPLTVPYCPSCALNAHDCPGHFGHIELVVPCYHPILFAEIVQLLRLKCFRCHRLQASPHQLQIFLVKFRLLYRNRMSDLAELDQVLAAAGAGAKSRHDGGDGGGGSGGAVALARVGAEGMATVLERYRNDLDASQLQQQQQQQQRRQQQQQQSSTSPSLTSHQRLVRKALVGEMMAACKAKACPHCGAAAPSVRGDAGNKIFLRYSKAAQRINSLERRSQGGKAGGDGAVLESALKQQGDNRSGYESDDTVPEPLDGDDVNMDDKDDDDDGGSSDDENHGGNSRSNLGRVEDQDSDEEGGEAAASGKHKDKYMHPGEVQAQLRRTWDLDPFLCSCLFGFGFDNEGSAASASSSGLNKFFLQAVPVPPSRFRPPMLLGSMSIEHSQTQYLGKILQLNALVRTHLDTAGAAAGGGGGGGTTAPAASSSSSSKVYTTWMELQTTLNCFMDSSKDPSASPNTAPGIRQILERKEGLFRKNMMGKRVDFACRSVISPDPYIGANEIGLPRYFAHVLTYPTPVTDLNASHMRALVERGVETYPGARWVEVHGKRVDLTKMTRFKREALAANLLSAGKKTGMPAIVGRQLADGDYVLMNRQVRSSRLLLRFCGQDSPLMTHQSCTTPISI